MAFYYAGQVLNKIERKIRSIDRHFTKKEIDKLDFTGMTGLITSYIKARLKRLKGSSKKFVKLVDNAMDDPEFSFYEYLENIELATNQIINGELLMKDAGRFMTVSGKQSRLTITQMEEYQNHRWTQIIFLGNGSPFPHVHMSAINVDIPGIVTGLSALLWQTHR